MTAIDPTTKGRERRASRGWVGAAAALGLLWIAQVWGWFAATSCSLGALAGGTNVWVFTCLVGRLLSGAAPARYGALLAVKFVGLLAVLAGLIHLGWASAFPLAMGFLAATFVAPLLVERAGSLDPSGSPFPEKNAAPSPSPRQVRAPHSGFCGTVASSAGPPMGSHPVDGN